MKMKAKFTILLGTAGIIVTGSTALLFSLTTDVSMIPIYAEAESLGNTPIISPIASTKAFNINFQGDRTSDTAVFTTSTDMNWAKIYAYNTSSGKMRVALKKDSPSGQEMGAMTLNPGQADSMIGTLDPGTYYVTFLTTTAILKGSASGRIASTYQELESKIGLGYKDLK
ncbi:hypothetical protein MUG84_27035 [Paenibacillus sp. KQZ6P-2]|uniref:Uncharacterized protein n=1 Tax=Paenibacillus mangrovi TaxID=2931978 RepID=A0A9X1WWT5_9BACL|nr:hypothetical protein [Paenibacillus mangrovi]MCJ8015325.1 hypothetical protein [Paenibacillus mangrovi]